MTEVLKNRKRKFVVEIITGTVIDSNGKRARLFRRIYQV